MEILRFMTGIIGMFCLMVGLVGLLMNLFIEIIHPDGTRQRAVLWAGTVIVGITGLTTAFI